MLLALPLALLLAAGAAAQSLNFGTWAWDRASSSVPVVARTADDVRAARGVKPTLSPNLEVGWFFGGWLVGSLVGCGWG